MQVSSTIVLFPPSAYEVLSELKALKSKKSQGSYDLPLFSLNQRQMLLPRS